LEDLAASVAVYLVAVEQVGVSNMWGNILVIYFILGFAIGNGVIAGLLSIGISKLYRKLRPKTTILKLTDKEVVALENASIVIKDLMDDVAFRHGFNEETSKNYSSKKPLILKVRK
jgi:hypothetical protein